MTLAIIYLVLVGIGAFFGEITSDLLALGLSEHIASIVGKAIMAAAGILAAVRALYEAASPAPSVG